MSLNAVYGKVRWIYCKIRYYVTTRVILNVTRVYMNCKYSVGAIRC